MAGLALALVTFVLWGAMPALFKAMQEVPATEILAHRVIWALASVGGMLLLAGQGRQLLTILGNRNSMIRLAFSTVFITVNWLVFIWAVNSNHMLQASLGYYINPMMNVVLGAVVLKERLTWLQWSAVALVIAALGAFTVGLGEFPWISIVVGAAFSLYGFCRKTMPVAAAQGFVVETLILFPAAALYALYLLWAGESHFLAGSWKLNLLLIGSGIATAIPLVMFAAAARRMRYATLGFLQYITPTLQFVLAVVVYGEVFTQTHVATFVMIWIGIGMYTFESMRGRKRG